MPSLVFDFEDIHRRMLGDLKKPKAEPVIKLPDCAVCMNNRRVWVDRYSYWTDCDCVEGPF